MEDQITRVEKKLGSIERGAYWFGIIGRLSIFMGVVSLALAGCIAAGQGLSGENGSLVAILAGSVSHLVYGWLFLLGRDALEAVGVLIREMSHTV